MRVCEKGALGSAEERCASRCKCVVLAIKPGHRYGRVCVLSSLHSPVDSYLCVYVRKALLEVRKRGALLDVCCASDQAWVWVRVCMFHLRRKSRQFY